VRRRRTSGGSPGDRQRPGRAVLTMASIGHRWIEPVLDLGEPGVVATGISYAFSPELDRKPVLSDINLTVGRGEFVILTGPSGAGKTTLITLIGALRSVQTGSLWVLGHELAGLSPLSQQELRRRIGFIFQEHNLFDALTPFETLTLAMHLRGTQIDADTARREATEMLAALGIEDYLHAKPRELSTGQKQRVAIARALINQPALVLADEPTASLDRVATDIVIGLLRKRAQHQGSTILLVTHDNQLFDRADRVVTIVDGRIAREGRVPKGE
jgi:putative ABC transport system ATP-binding protein